MGSESAPFFSADSSCNSSYSCPPIWWKAPRPSFKKNDAEALSAFLQENMADAEKYLAVMEDGSLMMAPAILELFGLQRPDREAAQENESAVFGRIEVLLEDMEKEDQALAAPKGQTKEKPQGILRRAWNKAKSMGRKVYKGIRAKAAYLKKVLCKNLKAVWKRIKEYGNAALHAMSHVFRRGRQVMQTFWTAMRAFLKFLADGMVETLSPEGSCVSIIRGTEAFTYTPRREKSEALYKDHCSKLAWVARVFGTACDIIGAAIQVAVMALTGPIGWFRLGVKIFKALAAVLVKYSLREISLLEVLLT